MDNKLSTKLFFLLKGICCSLYHTVQLMLQLNRLNINDYVVEYFFRRIIPLPKLTDQSLRVTFVQIKDGNLENYNYDNFMAYAINVGYLRLSEDILNTEIYIYDYKYVKPAHFSKINPIALKKSIILVEVSISFWLLRCYIF